MRTYKINEIENKRILGRNVQNAGKENKPLALFWAGSALELKVKASEIWVELSSDYDSSEPWVSIFINKSPVSRFMVEKGEHKWVCIAKGLNPENEYLISIYKATQPMAGDAHHSLLLHQIKLNDEGQFCELEKPELKLEFIGDSITSGEGLAGGPGEMDWIPAFFDGSKTYAARLARKLNADFATFSQSGWGLCWGWDGNRNNKMPPFYETVCGVMTSDYQKELGCQQSYDFGKGSDFVILNLGTNDNSAFGQPAWKDETGKEHPLDIENNGKEIAEGAVNFLKLIRKHNPDAHIIWSWGMLKLETAPVFIQAGIDAYKKETGDQKVYTLVYEDMEAVEKTDDDKGSRFHPGPLSHRLGAEKLEALINQLK